MTEADNDAVSPQTQPSAQRLQNDAELNLNEGQRRGGAPRSDESDPQTETLVETTIEADDGSAAADISDAALDEIRRRGVFTIALMGFGGTGKTFFLNRVKDLLPQVKQGYRPDPPKASNTTQVQQSEWIQSHWLLGKPSFVVIDLPGDRFFKAVTGHIRSNLRRVLFGSHAFLVLVPAREALLGAASHKFISDQKLSYPANAKTGPALKTAIRTNRRQVQEAEASLARAPKTKRAQAEFQGRLTEARASLEKLEQRAAWIYANETCEDYDRMMDFIDHVGRFSTAASALKKAGSPDRLTDEDLRPLKTEAAKDLIAFFVLSKADTLSGDQDLVVDPIRRILAKDPEALELFTPLLTRGPDGVPPSLDWDATTALIRRLCPRLISQANANFRLASFGLAAAFVDQSTTPLASQIINYHRSHFGVSELVLRLLDLRRHTDEKIGAAFRGLLGRRS